MCINSKIRLEQRRKLYTFKLPQQHEREYDFNSSNQ